MKQSELFLLVEAIVLACLLTLSRVSAQSAATDWEETAGGKAPFDVAFVKQNKSGIPPVGDNPWAHFPLHDGDAYTSDRGYLSVKNFGTMGYIDQLGLKLKPSTGWIDKLVIDHIDEPSPN